MLTYDALVRRLDVQVAGLLTQQVADSSRPDFGGFVSPADGMAGGTSLSSAAALGYAYLLEGAKFQGDPVLVERIQMAAAFGRRVRRPSGCFDLVITNFDSAPDTAFLVKLIAPVVRAARKASEAGDDGAGVIAEELGEIVYTAAPGMAAGGFHTPNHRWVLVAALSLARSLFPDLDVMGTIDAYLSETIDINADGEYTERSTSVYNAVCNRALRIAAAELERPELLEPVRRNLDLSYRLIHADGTVVTSISRRQDRAARVVPGRLMDSFYWMARLEQNGFYASVADWLHDLDGGELPWALHPFLEFPEWRKDNLERVEMPEVYSEVYSTSKLWRVRRGSMSATVTAGLSTPFGLKYGSAELRAVKLCASYFGTSQFVGETFEKVDGGVRLRHPGKGWVYDSPGYFHPVGRPVEQEALREVRSQRKFTPVPPLVIDLDVREVKGGFDLYATTPEGMDGVPFQIECVFEPGGEFDFEGGAMRALEGQTVFLKSGTGVYHQGRHAISIGPGAGTHRMWQMHNSEKSPDGFRVLVTLVTPVDRVLEVRYGTWSTAEEGMVSDL